MMKGMKGKMMKKLKSVKSIAYLNPDRVLQVSVFDGFVDNLNLKPTFVDHFNLRSTFVDNFPFKPHFKSHPNPQLKPEKVTDLKQAENVDVDQLIKDVADGEDAHEVGAETQVEDKENIAPSVVEGSVCSVNEIEDSNYSCTEVDNDYVKGVVLDDGDVITFKRPDMDSWTLFDPNLLAAFNQAVSEYMRNCDATTLVKTCEMKQNCPYFQPEEQADPLAESGEESDPLLEFEEKCPPGGSDSVILYTTSLRGIRKTFEDCQRIRFLIQSFGVVYFERDVSMELEFRNELWCIMGEKALPPSLFIRGRYIGGAERVVTLHEQGRLRALFRDIPIDFSEGPCHVCSGLRFILCYTCNGSRKLFNQDGQGSKSGGLWRKCSQCNENGLIVCPLC